MLTPAAVAADLAADRTRTLLAEAEAHRLARAVTADRTEPPETSRWWRRERRAALPSVAGGSA
jgi:hypothetical protein